MMSTCRVDNNVLFVGMVMALMAPGVAHAAVISETSVGVYDENVVQTNTVDSTAPGSIPLATFTADVATAWANDFGGVLQFDGTATDDISAIDATYGTSHSKTLTITSGPTTNWATGPAPGNRLPISGAGALGTFGGTDNAFFLNLGSITGGVPGEAVLEIGFTALSRDSRTQSFTVTAHFDNGSTAVLNDVVAGPKGADDTFFGFAAPAGRSIVMVSAEYSPSFTSIDDVAFITGVPVPEPSTFALLLLSGFGLVISKARR